MKKYESINLKEWITERAEYLGEDISTLISDPPLDQLDYDVVHDGMGVITPMDFTAWTDNYVFYKTEYDGWKGFSCVKRNPPEK